MLSALILTALLIGNRLLLGKLQPRPNKAYSINYNVQSFCTTRERAENPGRFVKKSQCNTRPSDGRVCSCWGEATRRLAAAVQCLIIKGLVYAEQSSLGSY